MIKERGWYAGGEMVDIKNTLFPLNGTFSEVSKKYQNIIKFDNTSKIAGEFNLQPRP